MVYVRRWQVVNRWPLCDPNMSINCVSIRLSKEGIRSIRSMIGVHVSASRLLKHILHERFHVLKRPLFDPAERTQREAFDPFGEAQIIPATGLLSVLIAGPGPDWKAVGNFLDIDKASISKILADAALVAKRLSDLCCGLVDVLMPLNQGRSTLKSVIISARSHVDVDIFEPTIVRLEMAVLQVSVSFAVIKYEILTRKSSGTKQGS